MSPNANSIIHHNKTEPQTHRKEGIGDAVTDSDGGGEGGAEGRVRRGHSPGRKEEPEIPFPVEEEIEQHLNGLAYEPR